MPSDLGLISVSFDKCDGNIFFYRGTCDSVLCGAGRWKLTDIQGSSRPNSFLENIRHTPTALGRCDRQFEAQRSVQESAVRAWPWQFGRPVHQVPGHHTQLAGRAIQNYHSTATAPLPLRADIKRVSIDDAYHSELWHYLPPFAKPRFLFYSAYERASTTPF
jgi:hypothetical protein